MLQIHDWSVLVSKPMGVLSDCMFLFPPEDRISGMRAGRRTRRESDGDSPFSLLPARRRLGLRFGEENSHKFDRLVAFRLLANLVGVSAPSRPHLASRPFCSRPVPSSDSLTLHSPLLRSRLLLARLAHSGHRIRVPRSPSDSWSALHFTSFFSSSDLPASIVVVPTPHTLKHSTRQRAGEARDKSYELS